MWNRDARKKTINRIARAVTASQRIKRERTMHKKKKRETRRSKGKEAGAGAAEEIGWSTLAAWQGKWQPEWMSLRPSLLALTDTQCHSLLMKSS